MSNRGKAEVISLEAMFMKEHTSIPRTLYSVLFIILYALLCSSSGYADSIDVSSGFLQQVTHSETAVQMGAGPLKTLAACPSVPALTNTPPFGGAYTAWTAPAPVTTDVGVPTQLCLNASCSTGTAGCTGGTITVSAPANTAFTITSPAALSNCTGSISTTASTITVSGVTFNTSNACTITATITSTVAASIHVIDSGSKVTGVIGGVFSTHSNFQDPIAIVNVNSAVATTAPANKTVDSGQTATFNTTASGGSGGYTYQWQVNSGSGFVNVSTGSGGTTNTYMTGTLLTAQSNSKYQVIVTDSIGGTVTSAAATVTVNPAVAASTPANQSVSIGQTATFSTIVSGGSGTGYTYQWQVNSGSGFGNVSTGSGGTTATYTTGILSLANSGSQYQVIVTDSLLGTATSVAATLTVVPPPLTLSRTFSPNSVRVNTKSEFQISIANTASGAQSLTGVSLTDTLPAGVVIANPSVTSLSGCGGGTLTAIAAGSSVTLSGGSISGGTVCIITVNVTSAAMGTYTNSTAVGAVTSTQGAVNSNAALATLTVTPTSAVTVNKTFTPSLVQIGVVSVLQISIANTGSNAIELANVLLTDTLPANLFIATTPNASLSGSGCSGTLAAAAGTSSVGLSNGSIAAGATCIITVNVSSSTAASYVNTINATQLTSTQGVTNNLATSATLTVSSTAPLTLNKAFFPSAIAPGGTSTLQINITNPIGAVSTLTGVALTDYLPTNIAIANPAVASFSAGCGSSTLTAPTGGGTITLTNASIVPGATCTIQVNVTSSTAGTYTNTLAAGALSSNQGVTNALAASATLFVTPVTLSKTFSPSSMLVNQVSQLQISIANPSGAATLTNVGLQDVLPTNVVITTPLVSSLSNCGSGTLTIGSVGGSNIILNNATVTGGNTCIITINVTSSTPGMYTNILPAGALISSGGVTNSSAASATLTVSSLGLSQTFTPSVIAPGATSTLQISIANTEGGAVALAGVALTDTLPTNILIAPTPNASLSGCSGTLTATPGNNQIVFSGGSIAANNTCIITVSVTSSTLGTYTSTLPIGAVTSASGVMNTSTASAILTVSSTAVPPVTLTKTFNNNSVSSIVPGGTATLAIGITNTASVVLNNAALTDTLPSGLVIAPIPNAVLSGCGGGTLTATAGGGSVALSGGTIGANGGVCTISVSVTSSTLGTYTNTLPVGALTSAPNAANTSAASATLTVALATPVTVSKVFSSKTISPAGKSTLTINIANMATDAVALAGVGLTDALPTGLVVNNPPNASSPGCGGTFAPTVGSGSVTLSGGSISAKTTCILTVDVTTANLTATAAGTYMNTLPVGAVTTSAATPGVTNANAASDTLFVTPVNLTKSFSPNLVAAGQTSQLQISIANPSGADALTGVGLQDVLPSGLAVASAASSVGCGSPSLTTTSNTIQLSGGSVSAGGTCIISVYVVGITVGTYTNTLPVGAVISTSGVSNSNPASATLTVPAVAATTPANETVDSGQTATFSTIASGGSGTYTYQWQVNSGSGFVNVSTGIGGTTANYTTDALSIVNSGLQYQVIVSDSFNNRATSGIATVTVNPALATTAPANKTVDSGQMATFSTVASGGSGVGYTYQWQVNGGSGFVNVSTGTGGTTANYTTGTLSTADSNSKYQVIVTDSLGGTVTSAAATVTVNPVLTTTAPVNATVDNGQTVTFSTIASGGSSIYTYQWQVNSGSGFVNVSTGTGGTTASYTTGTLSTADSDSEYQVIVSDSLGESVTSSIATVTVNPILATTAPANATVDSGQMATFSTTASGGSGTYTYQWQVNSGSGFVNVSTGTGGTTASYTTGALSIANNGSQYQVVVKDSFNNSVTSSTATVTIDPVLVTTAPANASVDSGQTATFSTIASGGRGGYTYQWQVNSGSGFVNVSTGTGSTTASYTTGTLSIANNGTQYQVIVTDSLNSSVTSSTATVTVNPVLATTAPANASVDSGQTATFSTMASGGSGTYTYQWQVNSGSGFVNVSTGTGGTAASYTTGVLSTVDSNSEYQVIVSDSLGESVTSSTATVMVNPAVVAATPANATVDNGQMATFSTVASGGSGAGYTYQWQVNTGSGFVNVSGATAASYTTPVLHHIPDNGTQYQVIVTDSLGGSVTSGIATVTVNPALVTTAPANATVDNGQTATFSTTASGGSGIYTYQWQVNSGSGFVNVSTGSGGMTASYTTSSLSTVESNSAYQVIVSDSLGQSVTSAAATVMVNSVLATTAPENASVDSGQTATFSTTASGGSGIYTYQWQVNSSSGFVNVSTGTGGTTASYTTGTLSTADSNSEYQVIVSDSLGQSVASAGATVMVNPAVIVPTPANATVDNGQTATFSTVASGGSGTGYTYQWQVRVNGSSSFVDVSSGTGGMTASYTTASLVAADSGSEYQVIVTDSLGGRVISVPATLTVLAPALILSTSATPTTISAVGELIFYRFVVRNTGNTDITNLVITDVMTAPAGPNPVVSCPSTLLIVGASMICTASYSATQADLDNGSIVNSVMVSGGSGSMVVTGPPSVAQVLVQETGSLTLVKKTVGRDGTFNFISSIPDSTQFSLTTNDGFVEKVFPALPIGQYTLQETDLPLGWRLTSVECNGVAMDVNQVLVSVAGGGKVTCVFTNTFDDEAIRRKTLETISTFLNKRAHLLLAASPDRRRIMSILSKTLVSASAMEPHLATGRVGVSLASSFRQLEQDASSSRRLDFWTEAHASYFGQNPFHQEGRFGLVYFGTDYLFSDTVVAGVLAQLDSIDETNGIGTRLHVNGQGWMAGPYLSARLLPDLYMHTRLALGTSQNKINPFAAYDHFTTTRQLFNLEFMGNVILNKLRISPSLGISYFNEKQQRFTNVLGVSIPYQNIKLGQMNFGPELGYPLWASEEMSALIRLSFQGIYDFQSIGFFDQYNEPSGLFARLNLGIELLTRRGVSISPLLAIDGLGASPYQSIGGQVQVRWNIQ